LGGEGGRGGVAMEGEAEGGVEKEYERAGLEVPEEDLDWGRDDGE
jgi:hypothetical protein